MYYSIIGLCPSPDNDMGGHGFSIKLYPEWKNLVANSKLTQENVDGGIENMGREWLDACGFGAVYDPDQDCWQKQPPGPNAYELYRPGQDLRIRWGEWGSEHITVPGNACGLDIDRGIFCPPNGRVLHPHNIDNWRQVNLLLVVFCWFAEFLCGEWEMNERSKRGSTQDEEAAE